jgi:hypothetical protein
VTTLLRCPTSNIPYQEPTSLSVTFVFPSHCKSANLSRKHISVLPSSNGAMMKHDNSPHSTSRTLPLHPLPFKFSVIAQVSHHKIMQVPTLQILHRLMECWVKILCYTSQPILCGDVEGSPRIQVEFHHALSISGF